MKIPLLTGAILVAIAIGALARTSGVSDGHAQRQFLAYGGHDFDRSTDIVQSKQHVVPAAFIMSSAKCLLQRNAVSSCSFVQHRLASLARQSYCPRMDLVATAAIEIPPLPSAMGPEISKINYLACRAIPLLDMAWLSAATGITIIYITATSILTFMLTGVCWSPTRRSIPSGASIRRSKLFREKRSSAANSLA